MLILLARRDTDDSRTNLTTMTVDHSFDGSTAVSWVGYVLEEKTLFAHEGTDPLNDLFVGCVLTVVSLTFFSDDDCFSVKLYESIL
jgi:hypothetical protein